MRFVLIELNNFLSYGGLHKLSLAKQGLVAVTGKNGCGKTTAFADSICWCLFGKTTKGLLGSEVVNNVNKKDCYVSLEIEDDDGTNYKIIRTQNSLKSRKSNDLIIESNGKDITRGIKSDTQQLVNNIIGMNMNTFVQSVLLISKGKSFCLMTDAEKKEILEEILHLNKLSNAVDFIKISIKESQLTAAKINEELEILKDKLTLFELNKAKLDELIINYSNEIIIKKKSLEEQKEKINIDINVLKKETNESLLVKSLYDIKDKATVLAKEETELTSKSLDVLRKISNDKSNNQQKLAIVLNKIEELSNTFENINKLIGTSCPTCSQFVSPQYSDTLFSDIDSVIKDYRVAKITLEDVIDKLKDKESEFITDVNSRLNNIHAESDVLKKEQDEIKDKINKAELDRQHLFQLEKQLLYIDNEILSLTNQNNPYKRLLEESKDEIRICKDKKQVLLDNKKVVERDLTCLNYWLIGFGNQGLKSYIIDSIIPYLTERTQYYADILTDGDYTISFSTQKELKSGGVEEDFHVNVINKKGSHIYKGNSDGEKQRINIAVGWAIGDLAASRALKPIKFRALDEPFESVDEIGEEAIISLFNAVIPSYESIFVISHKSTLQDKLPTEIEIIKEKEFSRIKENKNAYRGNDC